MVGISVTLQDLKDLGVVVPIKSPFNSLVWSLQKLDGSKIITVNYCKLNQAAVLIAADMQVGCLC